MLFEQLCDIFLEQNRYGPVYHGGKWDGKSPIKIGRGALGTGAYFSPIRSVAERYARENNGIVVEAYLNISNPLIIKMSREKPSHAGVLALELLGMDRNKAINMVERVEEQKGYLGKEISSRAIPQGYDCIFQYFDDQLREIVVWSSDKVITV